MLYQAAADGVLVVHLAVILFVVGGLVAVFAGGRFGWSWTADPRFRIAHLAAIGFVVAQAWLGRLCPLTVLESWLRERAGGSAYDAGFVAYWVGRVVYHDAPPWVFTAGYTAFGLLVILAWWRRPPRWR